MPTQRDMLMLAAKLAQLATRTGDETLRLAAVALMEARDEITAKTLLVESLTAEVKKLDAELAVCKQALLEAEQAVHEAQPAPAGLTDAQIATMRSDAWLVFNASEAPQEVRDVIEWYDGTLRAALTQEGSTK